MESRQQHWATAARAINQRHCRAWVGSHDRQQSGGHKVAAQARTGTMYEWRGPASSGGRSSVGRGRRAAREFNRQQLPNCKARNASELLAVFRAVCVQLCRSRPAHPSAASAGT